MPFKIKFSLAGCWGKIVGAICGLLLGGFFAILPGALLGHLLDRAYLQQKYRNVQRVRHQFFDALFLTMGHVAKIDGVVSAHELEAAREVMRHLRLTPAQTLTAMELFTEGKQPGFSLGDTLTQFKRACIGQKNLLLIFMQLQLQAAYAEGVLHRNKLQALLDIASKIGLAGSEFEQLQLMFQAQNAFRFYSSGYRASNNQHSNSSSSGSQQRSSQGYSYRSSPADELKNAYGMLGLAQGTPFEQVKKAYRRLMNQYHPDKLTAKGLPAEMIQAATEKSQDIQAAYDCIKKHCTQ